MPLWNPLRKGKPSERFTRQDDFRVFFESTPWNVDPVNPTREELNDKITQNVTAKALRVSLALDGVCLHGWKDVLRLQTKHERRS